MVALQKDFKKSTSLYFYNRCDIWSLFIFIRLSQRFNLKFAFRRVMFICVHIVSTETSYHLIKKIKEKKICTHKKSNRINIRINKKVDTYHGNGKAREIFFNVLFLSSHSEISLKQM
jgi:hypothetical protein